MSAEEKERIAKEKMLKRSEALQLLKDHMRKEIEEQERRQAEKERLKEESERKDRNATALEIARLEQIKKETLEKLKMQEEQQMTAVKRVLEAVASTVKNKVDKAKPVKRSRRHSSASSSSSTR